MSTTLTPYGRGIEFPGKVAQPGRLATTQNVQTIAANWRLILSTARGTALLNEAFGTELEKILFRGPSEVTEAQAEFDVREALTRYEPRAQVTQVRFSYPQKGSVVVEVHGKLAATGEGVYAQTTLPIA